MLTTTLNRIRDHHPCEDGWKKLLAHLGKKKSDDDPLPYHVILESNGLHDALWCMRAEPQYEKDWRKFSLQCARRIEHLNPICKPTLDVVELFLRQKATQEDLDAAWAAARAAAGDAVGAAAWDAVRAAGAAAWAAAWAAVRDAEREFQKQLFLEIVRREKK